MIFFFVTKKTVLPLWPYLWPEPAPRTVVRQTTILIISLVGVAARTHYDEFSLEWLRKPGFRRKIEYWRDREWWGDEFLKCASDQSTSDILFLSPALCMLGHLYFFFYVVSYEFQRNTMFVVFRRHLLSPRCKKAWTPICWEEAFDCTAHPAPESIIAKRRDLWLSINWGSIIWKLVI